MDAYHLVLQALHLIYRFKEGDRDASRKLLLRAVDRDPNYAMAYSLLAHWHILEVGEGRSTDMDHDAREASRYSELALVHDASDPLALALRGHSIAFLQGDLEGAVDMFDRALAVSSNSPIAWGMSSPTYAYLGRRTHSHRAGRVRPQTFPARSFIANVPRLLELRALCERHA